MSLTYKTSTYAIICPDCGENNYSIWGGEEGFTCNHCDYILGEEIDDLWEEVEADAIKCDIVNREVTCTPNNYNMFVDIPELMCPKCLEPTENAKQLHSIAIKYKNKWIKTREFLKKDLEDGLHKVKSKRDKITLYLLKEMTRLEDLGSAFLTPDPNTVKILWKGNESKGYIAGDTKLEFPCLRQIFVVKGER
jgi:hypothetical protein